MKKALQNPLVVGALAILAVIAVVRSTIKSEPVAQQTAAQSKKKSRAGNPRESRRGESRKKIDLALAQRIAATIERDPFNSVPEPETPTVPDQSVEPEIRRETTKQHLELNAVSLEGSRRFAVINGEIVERGERVFEYEVERILADQVILHGSGGRSVIGFRGSPDVSGVQDQPIAKHADRERINPAKPNP